MRLPKAYQPRKDPQGLRAEMVLNDFDLLFDSLGTQTEQLEQLGQGLVANLDVVGHGAALGSQGEAAVLFVVHETARGEAPHHVGHGRPAEFERGGNIHDPGIALLFEELLDPFQVVFGGFRAIQHDFLRLLAQCSHRRTD